MTTERKRPTLIAGNWKMYNDIAGTRSLIEGLRTRESSFAGPGRKVVVCPPFTSLAISSDLLKGSTIALGAQNMSANDEGAFTGEISWNMLKGVGCTYVIVGHSERRQYYGESDDLVNKKVLKALGHGLIPILCVGESLQQREDGTTTRVVSSQVRAALAEVDRSSVASLVIAYEPVWAIGTGKNATPDQAQEVHTSIRDLLASTYGKEAAEKLLILYGGSVKPDNAAELLRQPDIDGALVGGACLKPDSFSAIITATPA
jgi:triosephosphate isomerase